MRDVPLEDAAERLYRLGTNDFSLEDIRHLRDITQKNGTLQEQCFARFLLADKLAITNEYKLCEIELWSALQLIPQAELERFEPLVLGQLGYCLKSQGNIAEALRKLNIAKALN
ncbi:MAG TPA: hypothetical protein VGM92_14940, partial [Candidatus Kapabacteria bacterium]